MAKKDLVDLIDEIRESDGRYRREAYLFTMQALDQVVQGLSVRRHVSGQELLAGVIVTARQEFGPIAYTVFQEWGLKTGRDVGQIVFSLVEAGVLGKEPTDHIEDFEGGIDLDAELQKGGGTG